MPEFNVLEIVALHQTWLYELLHPHVPFVAIGQTAGVAETHGLNPQPLPPRDWGSFVGAELAVRISEGAVLTEAQSQTGGRFLLEVASGWCGNEPRWPHGFPHPPRPHPHPDPDPWRLFEWPHPEPWARASMFAAAALVFANYSARLEDGDLRNAFREAADTVGNQAVEELRAASEKAD